MRDKAERHKLDPVAARIGAVPMRECSRTLVGLTDDNRVHIWPNPDGAGLTP